MMINKDTFFVLVIECTTSDFMVIRNELHRREVDVRCFHVDSLRAMQEALDIRKWDLFIADCKNRNFCQSDIFDLWRQKGDGVPFIVVTDEIDRDRAVQLLECGISDIVVKENLSSLVPAMERWLSNYAIHEEFREKIRLFDDSLLLMQGAMFHFRTLSEARKLADLLALLCPEPEKRVFGLRELFINAVEHGNLGISYDEKTMLNEQDIWDHEVERRSALPENLHKYVVVTVERTTEEIRFWIQDQGEGFNWRSYLDVDPFRSYHSHGYGIAMAKGGCFDRMEYQGCGNTVLAVVQLEHDAPRI